MNTGISEDAHCQGERYVVLAVVGQGLRCVPFEVELAPDRSQFKFCTGAGIKRDLASVFGAKGPNIERLGLGGLSRRPAAQYHFSR
ncbi:hypothetical protein SBA6_290009 [Candidatus Sulfopaludibacter sp. SbA6]|nr:hypothetical protein SBA6_290009 [Candidatus Sulfopaludibacter sp. SbA6]